MRRTGTPLVRSDSGRLASRLEFFPKHLECEPPVLRRRQIGLSRSQGGGGVLEQGRITRVETGVAQGRLEIRDQRLKARDPGRKGPEVVPLVEAQLPL